METINVKDAVLYVDTYCYECNRRVALSNTIEFDGKRYCFRCDEKFRPFSAIFKTKELIK